MSDDHSLDLPYEEVPGAPVPVPIDPQSVLCGGIVVRSAAITADGVMYPTLIFDFFAVDGHKLPPIVLAAEDAEQLRKLPKLVQDCVDGALKAAQGRTP